MSRGSEKYGSKETVRGSTLGKQTALFRVGGAFCFRTGTLSRQKFKDLRTFVTDGQMSRLGADREIRRPGSADSEPGARPVSAWARREQGPRREDIIG